MRRPAAQAHVSAGVHDHAAAPSAASLGLATTGGSLAFASQSVAHLFVMVRAGDRVQEKRIAIKLR